MEQSMPECPRCRAASLSLKNNKVCCVSCNTEWPLFECPDCNCKTVLDRRNGSDPLEQTRFLCLTCGRQWPEQEMQYCPQCSQLRLNCDFEELVICRNAVGFNVCGQCFRGIFK